MDTLIVILQVFVIALALILIMCAIIIAYATVVYQFHMFRAKRREVK